MATDEDRARDERLRRDRADAERGRAIYLITAEGQGAYVRAVECEQCFAPIREEVMLEHLDWHERVTGVIG